MAPSDAAEKNCNIGAQIQSLTCIKAPKMFWKIYFLYDFWCAKPQKFALKLDGCKFCTIGDVETAVFLEKLSYLYTAVHTEKCT